MIGSIRQKVGSLWKYVYWKFLVDSYWGGNTGKLEGAELEFKGVYSIAPPFY